jgi:hypothetical protein
VGLYDPQAKEWRPLEITLESEYAPDTNAWGDYLSLQAIPEPGSGWMTVGYGLRNGADPASVTMKFVIFRVDK